MKPVPSAPNRPIISLNMTDFDIMVRAADLMGTKPVFTPSKNPRWKDSWRLYVRGNRARQLMIQLRPLMGERRQAQIDAALAASTEFQRGNGPKLTLAQATEIRLRFAAGESAVSLAGEFGVTKWSVYRIKEGRRAS